MKSIFHKQETINELPLYLWCTFSYAPKKFSILKLLSALQIFIYTNPFISLYKIQAIFLSVSRVPHYPKNRKAEDYGNTLSLNFELFN